MVAKILCSISFLITRLALTSSFSESSLTVMPSEIVISRLIGGGRRQPGVWRPAREDCLLRASRRAAGLPCRRAWPDGGAAAQWAEEWRFPGASASDAWGAGRRGGADPAGRPERQAGAAHERLAGTNGPAVERLPGSRRGTSRSARRAASPARPDWARLLLFQPLHNIRPRRHHWPSLRLASERGRVRRTRRDGRPGRQSECWASEPGRAAESAHQAHALQKEPRASSLAEPHAAGRGSAGVGPGCDQYVGGICGGRFWIRLRRRWEAGGGPGRSGRRTRGRSGKLPALRAGGAGKGCRGPMGADRPGGGVGGKGRAGMEIFD